MSRNPDSRALRARRRRFLAPGTSPADQPDNVHEEKGEGVASDRTAYHVAPNADHGRWTVSRENNDRFREEYDTKDEAVRAAKERARTEEPSPVKVHRGDGNMDYESTHGDDPSKSPS